MSTTNVQPGRDFLQDPDGRAVAVIGASLLLAILFAFWEGFWEPINGLFPRWAESEELSHSWFLPAITLWMLYERREALAKSVGAPAAIAFVPAVGSLFLLMLGGLAEVHLLMHVGLVGLILSLPLLLGGWSLFRVMLVPLAYLVFIIPPPYWAVTVLSGQFQLMSSELGASVARALGGTVYLTGNVIQLPNATLAVVEACSGLRYLFPFLSLGALAAYFYKGPLWQRIAIFLSTIPITILMNSFRIAVTAWLVENYGSQHTEGALHFFEGWVVFLMCIALLILVVWAFTLLRGEKRPFAFFGFEDVDPVPPTGRWTRQAFLRNGIVLTVLILAAGVFAHVIGTRGLVIPERQDFATLGFEFPDLRSQDVPLDRGVEAVLAADDVVVLNFYDKDDELAMPVNVYAAYLESLQGDGTWHSPRQCLPGGGWAIAELDTIEADGGERGPHVLNRMLIQADDQRMLVYYWYDQRGTFYADEFVMKFGVLWDSMTRRRSDGAMVRVMTQIAPDESVEEAEARVEAMRSRLVDVLPAYVPA